jgi:CubicO group peptidase (beta-lactamase class C family)
MGIEGRSLFFNYRWADRAAKRPITRDTLFTRASLRKVFEATLLAQAVPNCDLRLDEPVAKYVTELSAAGGRHTPAHATCAPSVHPLRAPETAPA